MEALKHPAVSEGSNIYIYIDTFFVTESFGVFLLTGYEYHQEILSGFGIEIFGHVSYEPLDVP